MRRAPFPFAPHRLLPHKYVMYLSNEPVSKRFDPSNVSSLKAQAGQESPQEAHLTADSELPVADEESERLFTQQSFQRGKA